MSIPHFPRFSFKYLLVVNLADSPGWCTADQSRKAGWECTCLPSPATSSCSWSPEQCSPCADPRRSVCPRCCRPGCWRWSSPAPWVLAWTERGWREARCAALLTICRGQGGKVISRFPHRSQPRRPCFKCDLTCLRPEASWRWWSRSERWSHCTPAWCPGSSRSSGSRRCRQACCCLFRMIYSCKLCTAWTIFEYMIIFVSAHL